MSNPQSRTLLPFANTGNSNAQIITGTPEVAPAVESAHLAMCCLCAATHGESLPLASLKRTFAAFGLLGAWQKMCTTFPTLTIGEFTDEVLGAFEECGGVSDVESRIDGAALNGPARFGDILEGTAKIEATGDIREGAEVITTYNVNSADLHASHGIATVPTVASELAGLPVAQPVLWAIATLNSLLYHNHFTHFKAQLQNGPPDAAEVDAGIGSDRVAVRKSNVANGGWGLFAAKGARPGDVLTRAALALNPDPDTLTPPKIETIAAEVQRLMYAEGHGGKAVQDELLAVGACTIYDFLTLAVAGRRAPAGQSTQRLYGNAYETLTALALRELVEARKPFTLGPAEVSATGPRWPKTSDGLYVLAGATATACAAPFPQMPSGHPLSQKLPKGYTVPQAHSKGHGRRKTVLTPHDPLELALALLNREGARLAPIVEELLGKYIVTVGPAAAHNAQTLLTVDPGGMRDSSASADAEFVPIAPPSCYGELSVPRKRKRKAAAAPITRQKTAI